MTLTADQIRELEEEEARSRVPTQIEGITRWDITRRSGSDTYLAAWELRVEANSPDQAAERSTRVYYALMADDSAVACEKLDFDWHLHHHDGC